MKTALLLTIPAIICMADPPPEPITPTKGLDRDGNTVAFILLTRGEVVRELSIDGQNFRVIFYKGLIGLFNEESHAIVISSLNTEGTPPSSRPVGKAEILGERLLQYFDGHSYLIRMFKDDAGLFLVVFNDKGNAIFCLGNPGDLTLIPESMMPM